MVNHYEMHMRCMLSEFNVSCIISVVCNLCDENWRHCISFMLSSNVSVFFMIIFLSCDRSMGACAVWQRFSWNNALKGNSSWILPLPKQVMTATSLLHCRNALCKCYHFHRLKVWRKLRHRPIRLSASPLAPLWTICSEPNKRIDCGSGPIRAGGDKGDAEAGWLRGIVWENNRVTAQYPKPRFPESA